MNRENRIALFYARESVPNLKILDCYFKDIKEVWPKHDIELVIINRTFVNNEEKRVSRKQSHVTSYSDFLNFMYDNLRIGGIAIASSMNDRYVKNVEYGDDSVEVSITKEYDISFRKIYEKNKKDPLNTFLECKNRMDMVLYYDSLKDCLYEWHRKNNWMSHGYVRGLGFFINSHMEPIRRVIEEVCHSARDGMNLWENWYGHPLDSQHYREIDLDSGFMRITEVKEWSL